MSYLIKNFSRVPFNRNPELYYISFHTYLISYLGQINTSYRTYRCLSRLRTFALTEVCPLFYLHFIYTYSAL